jgi:hypothetical protein
MGEENIALKISNTTLKMLLDASIITPGQPVHPVNGKSYVGEIIRTGELVVSIAGELRTFKSPSGAAKAVEKSSINGWRYWGIKQDDGNLIPLSDYRTRLHPSSGPSESNENMSGN